MNALPLWSPQSPVVLTKVAISGELYGPIAKVTVTQHYISEEDEETGVLFKFPFKNEVGTITDVQVEVDGVPLPNCVLISPQDSSISEVLSEEEREQALSNVYEGQILLVCVKSLEPKRVLKIIVSYVTELRPLPGSVWNLTIPTLLTEEDFGEEGEEEEDQEEEAEYDLSVNLHVYGVGEEELSIDSPSHKNIDILFEEEKTSLIRYREKESFYNQYFILFISGFDNNVALAEQEPATNSEQDPLASCVLTFEKPFPYQETPIEIMLMVDCSSWSGSGRLGFLRRSLTYCLKNLPADSMFNVITYGSTYDKIFATSVPNSDSAISKACLAVHDLSLNLGNEQDLNRPLLDVYAATIHKNHQRELFIFSSGRVSSFSEVVLTIQKYSHNTRVFTVGIGKQTDLFLLQRLADAGRGRAEVIESGSDLEVILDRQLRRACQPRVVGQIIPPACSIPADNFSITTPTRLHSLFFDIPFLVYCSFPQRYLSDRSLSEEKITLKISSPSHGSSPGELLLTDSHLLKDLALIESLKTKKITKKTISGEERENTEREKEKNIQGLIKYLFAKSNLKELELDAITNDKKIFSLADKYHIMSQNASYFSKRTYPFPASPDISSTSECQVAVLSLYLPPLRYLPPQSSNEHSVKFAKKTYDHHFLFRYKQYCIEPPEGFPDTPITTGRHKPIERKSNRKGNPDKRYKKGAKRVEKNADYLPVAPLPVTEGRWTRPPRDSASEISRKAQGILNKLTLETFDPLSRQLINLGYPNGEILEGVITQVFNKALSEPNFSSMYADLCVRLALACPVFPDEKERKSFRYILLLKCQSQFQTKPTVDFPPEFQDWEKEEVERKQRKRAIGNIKFIGELYKHKIVSQTIISHCLNQLLDYQEQTAELQLESLSQLLRTVGQHYEKESIDHLKTIFGKIDEISTDKQNPSRIRFMLQDLIDLRNNRWVTRRKEDDPKLIAEIHRQAELEEQRMEQESRNVRRIPEPSTPKRETNAKSSSFDDSDFYGAKRNSFSNDPKKVSRAPGSTSPVGTAGTLGPAQGSGGTPGGAGGASGSGLNTSKDGWTEVSTASRQRRDSKGRKDGDKNNPRSDRSFSESERGQNVFSALSRDSDKPPKTRSEKRDIPASSSSPSTKLNKNPTPTRVSPRSKTGSGLSAETKSPEKVTESQLTLEAFEEKVDLIIEEYLQSHDQDEAVECLKELNAPKYNSDLVNKVLSISFEKSERDQQKLAKLFSELLTAQFLSANNFISGFKQIVEAFEDIEIDIPLAPKIIARFLSTGFNSEMMDPSFLQVLSPLTSSGKALSILVDTILYAIQHLGQAKISEKWLKGGFSVFDFSEKDKSGISDFITDHEQGDQLTFLLRDPQQSQSEQHSEDHHEQHSSSHTEPHHSQDQHENDTSVSNKEEESETHDDTTTQAGDGQSDSQKARETEQ